MEPMYKQTHSFARDFMLYLHEHHIWFMVCYRRNAIRFLFSNNTKINFADGDITVEQPDGTINTFGYAIEIEKLIAKTGI